MISFYPIILYHHDERNGHITAISFFRLRSAPLRLPESLQRPFGRFKKARAPWVAVGRRLWEFRSTAGDGRCVSCEIFEILVGDFNTFQSASFFIHIFCNVQISFNLQLKQKTYSVQHCTSGMISQHSFGMMLQNWLTLVFVRVETETTNHKIFVTKQSLAHRWKWLNKFLTKFRQSRFKQPQNLRVQFATGFLRSRLLEVDNGHLTVYEQDTRAVKPAKVWTSSHLNGCWTVRLEHCNTKSWVHVTKDHTNICWPISRLFRMTSVPKACSNRNHQLWMVNSDGQQLWMVNACKCWNGGSSKPGRWTYQLFCCSGRIRCKGSSHQKACDLFFPWHTPRVCLCSKARLDRTWAP